MKPFRIRFLGQKGKVGDSLWCAAGRQNHAGQMAACGTERQNFMDTGENLDLAGFCLPGIRGDIPAVFGSYDIIFIDRSAIISTCGECLKMLVDLFPETCFIITGSSAFNILKTRPNRSPAEHYQSAVSAGLAELLSQFAPFDILQNFESYSTACIRRFYYRTGGTNRISHQHSERVSSRIFSPSRSKFAKTAGYPSIAGAADRK